MQKTFIKNQLSVLGYSVYTIEMYQAYIIAVVKVNERQLIEFVTYNTFGVRISVWYYVL